QRIAHECELVGGQEIADVPRGVARRFNHLRLKRADVHAIAFAHGLVDRRNAARLGGRCDHAAAMARLKRLDTARVIVMVMGHENIGELPSGALERGFDRSVLRRVDGSGGHGFWVVHQNTKIVLEAEEQAGLSGHGYHSVPVSGLVPICNRFHGILASCQTTLSTCGTSTPSAWAWRRGASSGVAFARALPIRAACGFWASATQPLTSDCFERR